MYSEVTPYNNTEVSLYRQFGESKFFSNVLYEKIYPWDKNSLIIQIFSCTSRFGVVICVIRIKIITRYTKARQMSLTKSEVQQAS